MNATSDVPALFEYSRSGPHLFFNESGVVQNDESGLPVLVEAEALCGRVSRVGSAVSVKRPAVRVVPCRRAAVLAVVISCVL